MDEIVREALDSTGAASAVVFLINDEELALAAAAGVDGAPLEALVQAVKSPEHPIARTVRLGHAEFDVTPMAPGGPALRSHIPIVGADAPGHAIGVLALAHQLPLDAQQRRNAEDLAARAATVR
jgi:GAF domain